MCLGLPMQVEAVDHHHAWCHGRGQRRRIATWLVGACQPGEWLLVFLDDARERIDARRAAEINEVLDMLELAMGTDGRIDAAGVDLAGTPGFSLPSATSRIQLDARYNGVSTDEKHHEH